MTSSGTAVARRGFSLSLNAKICATATALVVLSLSVTALVIGIKSSTAAEAAAMDLARTAAREAGGVVEARIGASLTTVSGLAATLQSTSAGGMPLSREQVSQASKAALGAHPDWLGATVTFEPDALDGKDADYAGKKPEYDDTGRYMQYWVRASDGALKVEPIVFGTAAGANDWYDVPKASGRVFFTEPYTYPLNGKDVLMASLVAPIMVDGKFIGVSSADFMLTRLNAILADIKVIEGGKLALVSNGGMYASHPQESMTGKKADNLPAAALASVREGKPYEYTDSSGTVHLLQPLRVHADIAPWAVQLTFPHSVATASSRELLGYTLLVSVLCALAAALVLVAVLFRLTRPLRELGAAMTELSSGNADLSARLDVRGKDELAVISGGFNQFVAKIHDVLAQVRSSSDSVATASREIRQGNADLSARTEQQASALEETAASMEELTSTVRQNADNARQANQLAASASDVAVKGGAVVAQVVETMASINESSNKVVDIISVIDGIAFQT
ncbi:MAG: methyl-accepting chemotaxis protein, partial [Telluria sp.]